MNRKNLEIWLQFLLFLLDIMGIALSFIFAYWFRFNTRIIPIIRGLPNSGDYIRALGFTLLIWEILFVYNGLYKIKKTIFGLHDIHIITRSILIGTFILMALTFVFRNYDLSRWVVFLGLVFSILIINLDRWLFAKGLAYLRTKGWGVNRAIIIGTGHVAKLLADKIRRQPESGYLFVGFVNGTPEVKIEFPNEKPIGTIQELDKLAVEFEVNKIIIACPELDRDKVLQLMLQSEKNIVDFCMAPDLLEMLVNRVAIEEIDGFPLFTLKESPLRGWNIVIKRTLDIVVSGISLILLSPFLGLMALLIKMDSEGPIFYRQERIGIDGKHFTIYKFRSMKMDAEEDTGPVWTSPDDPRRTKLGSFMRKYNLDELPQFINVLKGDMSLVGPRPERPHFVNQFKEEIPRYMARHRVKSGITGWAQVNGWRGDTSIEERTKYDIYYIENWNLLLDIKILLMTLKARRNAY